MGFCFVISQASPSLSLRRIPQLSRRREPRVLGTSRPRPRPQPRPRYPRLVPTATSFAASRVSGCCSFSRFFFCVTFAFRGLLSPWVRDARAISRLFAKRERAFGRTHQAFLIGDLPLLKRLALSLARFGSIGRGFRRRTLASGRCRVSVSGASTQQDVSWQVSGGPA